MIKTRQVRVYNRFIRNTKFLSAQTNKIDQTIHLIFVWLGGRGLGSLKFIVNHCCLVFSPNCYLTLISTQSPAYLQESQNASS